MTASNFDPLALSGCCGTTMEKNVVIEKLQIARSKLRDVVYGTTFDEVGNRDDDGLLRGKPNLEKMTEALLQVEKLLTEVLS